MSKRDVYQQEEPVNPQQSPLLIRPNLSPQHPCSNGRCSARAAAAKSAAQKQGVLILVLMEDALRDLIPMYTEPFRAGS